MAKKSRKHSTSPQNNNGGCMWSLISLLDFRHPRYASRLLLDRRHGSCRYSSADKKYSKERGNLESNCAEKRKLLDYAGKSKSENGDPGRSIRLLLEEEISKLQSADKGTRLCSGEGVSSAEKNLQAVVPFNSTFRQRNDDLRISTYSEPSKPSFQDILERFSINLNLVALLQEFYSDRIGDLHANPVKDNFEPYTFMRIDCSRLDNEHGETSRQTIQSQYILRKTLNEILEVFLCDKINDLKQSGCTGLLVQSEQSSNALDVISLNKELFLKFLQDPNSHLAKYIKDLQVSHSKKLLSTDSCKVLEDIKLLGNNCGNQRGTSCAKQSRIQAIQGTFRKKDKNVQSSIENDNSQSSSRIVVLKPMPSRTGCSPDVGSTSTSSRSPPNSRASGQGEVAAFNFSFRQIKRKMRQAIERKKEKYLSSIKKEQQSASIKEPHQIQQSKPHGCYFGDSIKRIPVNGVYVDSKITSSSENALSRPSCDVKITAKKPILENTRVPSTKSFSSMDRESNFQREARKHIIDMLDFGYSDFHTSPRKVSRTLEKMLSSQDRNFSKNYSPGIPGNCGLSLSEIKLTPVHTPTLKSDAKQYSTRKTDLGGSADSDYKFISRPQLHEFNGEISNVKNEVSPFPEESIPTDGTESSDIEVSKDCNNLTSVDTDNGTSGVDFRIDGDLSPPHLRLGVIEVDQQILTPLAPPGVLLVKNMEAPECFTEKPKQPSPVSVLDTSCLDDCDSYRSTETTKIEPAELPVSPRNLQFEEDNDEMVLTTDESFMQPCTDKDLNFEYVRSLLEVSGLASRESWWRWCSSQHMLNPSLYDQVETASGEFLDDLKLLFDCVSEVLEEIRCRYCTRMPWVSFIQPNILPFPIDEDLTEEVWKGIKNVDSSLLVNRTLDQIVGRDFDTATWMDVRPIVSEIGVALEDEIWEDILEETMLALWD